MDSTITNPNQGTERDGGRGKMQFCLERAIAVYSATPRVIFKAHDESLSGAATPWLHPEIGPLPPSPPRPCLFVSHLLTQDRSD